MEKNVHECHLEEKDAELDRSVTYSSFADDVIEKKRSCIEYLSDLKRRGYSIAAYGASAKGGIFLNYLGIDGSVIDYIIDRNENKQGLLLAGTGIPVYGLDKLKECRPDLILILSWNLKEEIINQNKDHRFFVLMPEPQILQQT